MYTQAMDIPHTDGPTAVPAIDEQAREAEFNERAGRGEIVEAKDWMPEAYRRSASTRIPKLWACCPKVTGSRGRPA